MNIFFKYKILEGNSKKNKAIRIMDMGLSMNKSQGLYIKVKSK